MAAVAWVAAHGKLVRDIRELSIILDCMKRKFQGLLRNRPGPNRQPAALSPAQRSKLRKLIDQLRPVLQLFVQLAKRVKNIGWAGDPKAGPIFVYDDPNCKASSYALLSRLQRPPEGRDGGFEGSVFYCYSRLLERRAVVAEGVTLKVDPSVTSDGNVKLNIVPSNTTNKTQSNSAKAGLPPNHVFIVGNNPFISRALRRILLRSIENTAVTTTNISGRKDNKAKNKDAKNKDAKDKRGSDKKGKKTSVANDPNAPTAGTKPGDVGGTLEIGYTRTFAPDIDIGRNGGNTGPLHGFRNDFNGFNARYRFWWLPKSLLGGFRPRIGAEVSGGVFGGTERKANSTSPGFIAFINGVNPALTAIARTQNTRLELDGFQVSGKLVSAWDKRLYQGKLLLTLLLGAAIAYSHYDYDYSTQVSAGAAAAALFTYNLNLRMKTLFAGVVMGAYLTWQVTNALRMSFGGEVEPGYQTYSLTAIQTGTALPPGARVTDNLNGFAFRARFGVRLNYDLSSRLRLGGFVTGGYDSAMPSILYPIAGGIALAAARHGGWKVQLGILLIYKYGLGY